MYVVWRSTRKCHGRQMIHHHHLPQRPTTGAPREASANPRVVDVGNTKKTFYPCRNESVHEKKNSIDRIRRRSVTCGADSLPRHWTSEATTTWLCHPPSVVCKITVKPSHSDESKHDNNNAAQNVHRADPTVPRPPPSITYTFRSYNTHEWAHSVAT